MSTLTETRKKNTRYRSIGVVGTGKYIPEKLVTNEWVENQCGLESGYVALKTGIESRFFAEENQNASDLAYKAAIKAITDCGVDTDDINLVICCTFTSDYVYPSMSSKLHKMLGLRNAGTFDVMANCTGFQVGLSVGKDMMQGDRSIKHCLVVGAALQNRFINWTDPNASIYFGDGAGAAVLSDVPDGFGIIASDIFTKSESYEAVRMRGGGSSFPITEDNVNEGLQFYELNGIEVWKQAIVNQPKSIRRCLDKMNRTLDDVDHLIFHQANKNLIEYLMAKMRKPIGDTTINVTKYGNTADASIAITLDEAKSAGSLKKGDLVLISGVGAGFIFGTTALIWH